MAEKKKSREKKEYSPDFLEYEEFIIENENYKGLPIERKSDGTPKWVASKDSKIGQERLKWADLKIDELHIEGDGPYAKLMYEIHPTKWKVCQICGRLLSLDYIYLNKPLINSIKKKFGLEFDECTSMSEACYELSKQFDENEIKNFIITKFKLKVPTNIDIDSLIDICEYKCRVDGTSNLLGPGAMSNFPDRFDGFHSYNRCCRKKEDKGRSDDNLKTYNKDRRAYEYWSDGNICSANGFMKSQYFEGKSADHIGPISLGFVHDSRNLQPLSTSDNSSKRDKLYYDSILKLIDIEKSGTKVISWYSEDIWDFIKTHLINNQILIEQYRNSLKQNMTNFMGILKQIKDLPNDKGVEFLTIKYLEPKLNDFLFDYTWNDTGMITSRKIRKITDSTRKEKDRLLRVSLDSIDEYNSKENRHLSPDYALNETLMIKHMNSSIMDGHFNQAQEEFREIMATIQTRLNAANLDSFKKVWSVQNL